MLVSGALVAIGILCQFYQSDELGLIDARAENLRVQIFGVCFVIAGLIVPFILSRRSRSK